VARRIAFDTPQLAVSQACVEVRRLEGDGEEHRGGAAASAGLLFGHGHDFAAQALSPRSRRQEDQVDEENAERRPADKPADDFACLGAANQHSQRAGIDEAGLFPVVAREAVLDDGLALRIDGVGKLKLEPPLALVNPHARQSPERPRPCGFTADSVVSG